MVYKLKNNPAKRFGVRYGRTLREKFGNIEREQRKLHKCPYCFLSKVKRVAAGIWNCRKCGITFTGKAYTLSKKRKITGVTAEEAEAMGKELETLSETEKSAEKDKEESEKKKEGMEK